MRSVIVRCFWAKEWCRCHDAHDVSTPTPITRIGPASIYSFVTPESADAKQCLVGFDAKVFSARKFGAANLDDGNAQLGAEQVVIVRDFADKNKLKHAIGDFALILTVMESKEMEFDDVLS